MREVLPIRRDRGSYSSVCMRLFYSASDPTKRIRCWKLTGTKMAKRGEGSKGWGRTWV